MALFRAVGLGVAIIVLQVLAPALWDAAEGMLLSFFSFASDVVHYVAAVVATLPPPAP